jgi:gamma-carbonic anhydrase
LEKIRWIGINKTGEGIIPQFGHNCYLADTAVVIGEVVMGDNCTVWFNAVIRGDVHSIAIGNNTNIQDGAIIHCTYQIANVVIGSNVSIAHRAIVHGCTIGDNVLIGMGAIIMDGAIIGENSVIAAGAVVLEKTVVEPESVYAGIPARKVRSLSMEMKSAIQRTALNYPMYAGWYQ